jgi:predicted nicotinamide N-methyase
MNSHAHPDDQLMLSLPQRNPGKPSSAFPGQQLYNELSAIYDLQEREIQVGSTNFSLVVVREPDSLLERILPEDFALDERMPYWAQLWSSSFVLARYCLEHRDLRRKRVLDLGCGLGLAGIAAAKAGASVVMVDYERDALRFARLNAGKNLAPETGSSSILFREIDWRIPGEIGRFDVILAGDVVYERRNFLPLLNLLYHALKVDGLAVFAEPDRAIGREFFSLAVDKGFEVAASAQLLEEPGGRTSTIIRGELRLPMTFRSCKENP